jgi:phosphoribosylformylglycinamidine synthase
VEEALRNVICAGGGLRYAALLDNYCAGSASDLAVLGQIVEVSRALQEAALAYGTPFISGKDSLNNAKAGRNTPTLVLVTAVGILEDIRRTLVPGFKKAGNLIYLLGLTGEEMGSSVFAQASGNPGGALPTVDRKLSPKILSAAQKLAGSGRAATAHDLSEGGLFAALAEMLLWSGLGAEVDLAKIPGGAQSAQALLFSESNSRFLMEIPPENASGARRSLHGIPHACIGTVVAAPALTTKRDSSRVMEIPVPDLEEAYAPER